MNERYYLSQLSESELEDVLQVGQTAKRHAPTFGKWLRYKAAQELVFRSWREDGREGVPGVLEPIEDWRDWSNGDIADANRVLHSLSYGVKREREWIDWLCYFACAEVTARLTRSQTTCND